MIAWLIEFVRDLRAAPRRTDEWEGVSTAVRASREARTEIERRDVRDDHRREFLDNTLLPRRKEVPR